MKKMFKKVLTTALAATMLFPIVACGGGKKNNVNLDNDDMSKHVTLTFWTPIQSWSIRLRTATCIRRSRRNSTSRSNLRIP